MPGLPKVTSHGVAPYVAPLVPVADKKEKGKSQGFQVKEASGSHSPTPTAPCSSGRSDNYTCPWMSTLHLRTHIWEWLKGQDIPGNNMAYKPVADTVSTQYCCPSLNCFGPIKHSWDCAMWCACLHGHELKSIQACLSTVNCPKKHTTFDSTETLQNHLKYTHGVDIVEFLKSHPQLFTSRVALCPGIHGYDGLTLFIMYCYLLNLCFFQILNKYPFSLLCTWPRLLNQVVNTSRLRGTFWL